MDVSFVGTPFTPPQPFTNFEESQPDNNTNMLGEGRASKEQRKPAS